MTCRLYLLTPPKLEPRAFADDLKRALDAGDVACLQLRLKDASDHDILRAAEVLMPIAQSRDVAFIVNDRPDLAHMIRADGVHVGQDDVPYAQAREIVGKNAIVGVTCHNSRELAFAAGEAGADYIAFGAFFPTATKDAKTHADLELLEWWAQAMTVPVVAIGGITVENAKPLIDAGADFIAVSSGVWGYKEGAAAAVRDFNKML